MVKTICIKERVLQPKYSYDEEEYRERLRREDEDDYYDELEARKNSRGRSYTYYDDGNSDLVYTKQEMDTLQRQWIDFVRNVCKDVKNDIKSMEEKGNTLYDIIVEGDVDVIHLVYMGKDGLPIKTMLDYSPGK